MMDPQDIEEEDITFSFEKEINLTINYDGKSGFSEQNRLDSIQLATKSINNFIENELTFLL